MPAALMGQEAEGRAGVQYVDQAEERCDLARPAEQGGQMNPGLGSLVCGKDYKRKAIPASWSVDILHRSCWLDQIAGPWLDSARCRTVLGRECY